MDISRFSVVRIVVGDEDAVIDVPFADLLAKLRELSTTHEGEVQAFADDGPRPFWHRLFGASRYVQLCFLLRWQGTGADLCLYDENNSEYRATPHDADPAGQLGEDALPLAKELALAGLRDFIGTGHRPDYLKYRFEK